ncbi:hypothetical protein F5Y14DRAFT_322586 [Nemania sp. NC0429]|nr:hypothetical protein F5Y14DRAFT_322586 [Nemania sp. NC0429]
MVYCGKPSRGCQMCRTRRIKCDETRPTCAQCAKSRRQCPGYKDDFDLVFRNETQATERRALGIGKKSQPKRPARQPALPIVAMGTSGGWSLTSLPGPSMEEQASCHFIANFVLLPKDGRTVGYLDYVLPLLREEGPDSHIQHAFNACSLAFMDNRRGVGNGCWSKALGEYGIALSKTNGALRDRDSQHSDVTLAAVILLGMFESISAKQLDTLSWGSHIEGAVQMVKARGKRQTRTKRGLQLFIAVRTLMSIYCLTAQQSVNSMGADWWLDNSIFSKTAATVQRLMIRTSEVRSQVMHLIGTYVWTPDNAGLMLEVIRKAQAVEQEVVAWQQSVPEDWHPRTVVTRDHGNDYDYDRDDDDDDDDVFAGHVDVYSDVWIGSVANSARAVRLILHSLIMRCVAWVCSPADYRTTPEYATAAAVSREAIAGIIASAPYFLGWHLEKKKKNTRRSGEPGPGPGPRPSASFGTFACGEEADGSGGGGAKGLAAYLLTWPLTCVMSNDHTTDAQRAWVLERLRKIGSELGIKYALAMCELRVRVPSLLIFQDALKRSQGMAAVGGSERLSHAEGIQQQWGPRSKTRADES